MKVESFDENDGLVFSIRILRAVMDTNVLVSALRSNSGAAFALIRQIISGSLKPVVTVPLVFEYEDVLHRTEMVSALNPKEINDFLDWFVFKSEPVDVHFL